MLRGNRKIVGELQPAAQAVTEKDVRLSGLKLFHERAALLLRFLCSKAGVFASMRRDFLWCLTHGEVFHQIPYPAGTALAAETAADAPVLSNRALKSAVRQFFALYSPGGTQGLTHTTVHA